MKIKVFAIAFAVVVTVGVLSGCIGENGDEENENFSETYTQIMFTFEVRPTNPNETSHIIIPAPVQNGKTLDLWEKQYYPGFENLSIEFVDTEKGSGIKIAPVPSEKVWLWFECEPYTCQAPFDIDQTEQYYESEYPGLSTWETDGEKGYYWFYSDGEIDDISFVYEYSDCYGLRDKGSLELDGSQGWVKTEYTRVQELMPM